MFVRRTPALGATATSTMASAVAAHSERYWHNARPTSMGATHSRHTERRRLSDSTMPAERIAPKAPGEFMVLNTRSWNGSGRPMEFKPSSATPCTQFASQEDGLTNCQTPYSDMTTAAAMSVGSKTRRRSGNAVAIRQ